MRRQRAGRHQLRGAGEIHVDDDGHAFAAGECFDALGHRLGLVKNRLFHAGRLGVFGFGGRAHRADHPATRQADQLGDVVAHRRRCARDQHRFVFQVTRQMHRLNCRQSRNAQASASGKVGVGRQDHGLARRQDHPFAGRAHGACPLAIPNPNPLTHAARIHTGAHRIDHACAVAVRHDAWITQGAGAARFHVRRVHARGVQAHPHLARARLGCGHFAHHDHVFGFSVVAVPGCTHGDSPVRWWVSLSLKRAR